MRHGRSPQRPVLTPTIPSWLRPLKNGRSSCSPDCFRVSTRSLRRSTAVSVLEIQQKYPGDQEKIAKMAIIYDGQVRMAHLAIVGSFSVNGVARLHTEILEKQELKTFYEMMPQKFNNKTNGITQRRFLLHGKPASGRLDTDKIGDEWITDLSAISKLKLYVDDEKCQQEFMNIKYQNKVRLAKIHQGAQRH